MQTVTLFKTDSTGKTREWNIWVDQNADGTATIQVLAGIMGGKMVPSQVPIKEGKNIGRSNETTAYQQAVLEAKSEIDSKLTHGYVDDLSKVKAHGILGSGIPAPMLAQKFDPKMKQKGSKNLEKLKLKGKRVYIQRKFDGNRCVAHVTLGGATLYTRKGKKFIPIQHIQDALVECFKKVYDYVNGKYGVTEYWVDGELFSTAASFNTINGILKKGQPDMFQQQLIETLEYHVYDIILDAPYETRYKVTQYFDRGPIKRVESIEITAEDAILEDYFLKFLAEGMEGLMIRQIDQAYENKRTWQLLKYKAFEDDEFEIVGFEESRKKDTLGSIIFKQTSHPVAGPVNQTFRAATTGLTAEDQKEIWDNQSKYLGTKMTVEYFGFSPIEEGGRPRFPKAKGQRVEEDVED
jgi:ATP-dependent DNA ligase